MAKEQRRDALRRRRAGLAAGAALGIAAFGVAAPAQGATFTVTTTADTGAGSLRQAILDANGNAGDDAITFAGGLNGTIRLTSGALPISSTDGTTITGPGAAVISVSGDANANGVADGGDSRVFDISDTGSVSISGLTITGGYADGASVGGGAILVNDSSPLTLTDSTVTNSRSDSTDGAGGIALTDQLTSLTLVRSTISGNSAPAGPGGGIGNSLNPKYLDSFTITDSVISGNSAQQGGGLYGAGRMTMDGSTISGNTAGQRGGGMVLNAKYDVEITNSRVTGNTAPVGGGLSLSSASYAYSTLAIKNTSVSGNQGGHGAGIELSTVLRGHRVTIDRSTISGNDGGADSFGGGLLVDAYMFGALDVRNSTISGNTAASGGGVAIGSDDNHPVLTKYFSDPPTTVGSIRFDNSTIASNSATVHGGGIYLSQYDSVTGSPTVKKSATATVTSTIVADNGAEDLDRVDTSTSGGFDSAFALIEAPGDAPLTKTATIIGTDPKLGALADNGGPTRTELPAGTSPVLDQGHAGQGMTLDQRGQPRTAQTDLPDPAGGDGTDIGAVELAKSAVVIPVPPAPPTPPPAPKQAFTVTLRGLKLGALRPPLLIAGSTPVGCSVSFGSIASCAIEIRAAGATKTRSTTVAAGTLLANGEVVATTQSSFLSTGVRLTRAGKAVLERRPLGLVADAAVHGAAQDPVTAVGKVRLLHSPRITLRTGSRSRTLSPQVLARLGRVADLITGAKSVSCTAFTNPGRGDVALTDAQAKAACAELVKRGVTGKISSSGSGHAYPIATNRTPEGRVANRRIRISFRY
ncbi:MAG: hypothetical protein JWM73_2644 [Solirubrobacterales bacterium]|nr:hypothetical protein [Solirubrobacterales bacterium]